MPSCCCYDYDVKDQVKLAADSVSCFVLASDKASRQEEANDRLGVAKDKVIGGRKTASGAEPHVFARAR